MKFCCGITLYNSSLYELENLLELENSFERIFLFDNTDNSKKRMENEKFFLNNSNFNYITDNGNSGLAVAYNIMCRNAINENYDYICLLDQDSIILPETIKEIKLRIINDDRKNIAVYVPNIIYSHKNNLKNTKQQSVPESEIEWAISSGSLINLEAYSETEGFDENYFIDRLDYDYCVQVKHLGYKIIRYRDIVLHQRLGETKKFFCVNISQHNPIRHYYIFRNRLYYYLKKMPKSLFGVFRVVLLSVKHLITVFLFEDNKILKLKMMYKGWKDFRVGNMGKMGST